MPRRPIFVMWEEELHLSILQHFVTTLLYLLSLLIIVRRSEKELWWLHQLFSKRNDKG
jgi:hypothetical protein